MDFRPSQTSATDAAQRFEHGLCFAIFVRVRSPEQHFMPRVADSLDQIRERTEFMRAVFVDCTEELAKVIKRADYQYPTRWKSVAARSRGWNSSAVVKVPMCCWWST
jgi:hypothetical protein